MATALERLRAHAEAARTLADTRRARDMVFRETREHSENYDLIISARLRAVAVLSVSRAKEELNRTYREYTNPFGVRKTT